MRSTIVKEDVIQRLQEQVLAMQGHRKPGAGNRLDMGLGTIEAAFPGRVFPVGGVHEFISRSNEDATATNGFISGLLGRFMQKGGISVWVSMSRTIFPVALKFFGIEPDAVIFIDLRRSKDALWVIEEALKCEAVTCVVGELPELSFIESRRLQLAVEQSKVSGFIHRHKSRSENNVAFMTRWNIKSLPSQLEDGIPGVGFPRWNIELVKVRNGKPGNWQVEWSSNGLRFIEENKHALPLVAKLKTG